MGSQLNTLMPSGSMFIARGTCGLPHAPVPYLCALTLTLHSPVHASRCRLRSTNTPWPGAGERLPYHLDI